MNMKTKTPAIFIGILFLTGCQNLKEVDTTVYMDPSRPVEERVEALLEQMTLEEKTRPDGYGFRMGSGQHHESRILRFRRMDCGAGARSSQSPSVVLGEKPA